MADHYQVLGVSQDATQEEIKRAYRKKARTLHPDVNSSENAEEEFKNVTRAYEVLSDEKKRANYDATGNENGTGQQGFGAGGFGGFSDIFETFFGGGGRGHSGPASRARRGQDALITARIDLEDAVFGAEKTIDLDTAVRCEVCEGTCMEPGTHAKTCSTCSGQGQIRRQVQSILGPVMSTEPCPTCRGFGDTIPSPCHECGGQGRVRERVSMTVKIPSGVETGTRIQLAGRGEAGPAGGPNGDLYLEVRVNDHPIFSRVGDNLVATMTIPMTAAALGTELKLDTFDGEQTVKVKPGTQSGDVHTLEDLGVGLLRGNGRGDLQVTLKVETPTKLNDEQRELLKKLAEVRDEYVVHGQVESKNIFQRFKENWQNRD